MSTDKQFAANRDNAQLSTGPATAEGKAKVAANALTHGLNSNPETLFAAHPDQEAHPGFEADALGKGRVAAGLRGWSAERGPRQEQASTHHPHGG